VAGVTAAKGPFAVATWTIPRSGVSGFGGGVIYYPKDARRTYGGIAMVPGFTGFWSSISWMGPRLASQGFVVIGIETLYLTDATAARGRQLLAALDYLTKRSPVRSRVDPSRLGIAGHSMGGGGVLEAARKRTSLKAVIPLTPYHADKSWPEIRSPILIVGGEADFVTEASTNAVPLYNGLVRAHEKAYLEFEGAQHSMPRFENAQLAKYMISWFKRFVDNDTRYTRFLCPAPKTGKVLSNVRISCPM
jgi:dienelactone hydrolase